MNAANWSINASAYATYSTTLTAIFDLTETMIPLLPPRGTKIEVMDVACGPGEGSRRLARALQERNDGSTVLATDYAEGMVEEARKLLQKENLENVEFAVVDGMDMTNIPNNSKDAVTSQFGIICMPDGVKSLHEMHRILRPGGVVGVTTWERPINIFPTMAEAVKSLVSVNEQATSEDDKKGGPLAGTVFKWGDEQFLTDSLRSAGFVDVSVTRVSKPCTVAGADVEGFAGMLANNPGTLAYAEKLGLKAVGTPESRVALTNAIREVLERRVREGLPLIDGDAVALVGIGKKRS
ncbi:hypothetical protein HK101_006583 [Irineochytrium annulatum]|nr:hypothetical protein HK101_006583 [Irineochytrium annulatum]